VVVDMDINDKRLHLFPVDTELKITHKLRKSTGLLDSIYT